MSLLGTLLDVAKDLREDTPPRVPYTADQTTISSMPAGRGSISQQLDVTTSESTLWSVLDLLSSTTAAVKWRGVRPQTRAGGEPVEVTAAESLAVKLWQRPNTRMSRKHLMTLCEWHYDSVGEAWMVVDFFDKAMTLPRSWWPVRPDRMFPIPSSTKYLAGYVYVGPDGERVPLSTREVMRITRPHPKDPHRGIGPVMPLLTALGTSMSAQQWIAAFFRNDATPGGIIEIPEGLEEADYQKLRLRWNEQHRGVSKAHRVAIVEHGKWVPTNISMKDMQFTEIRALTRDQIMECYRIHKHKMGIAEHVNLANAGAAGPTYEKDLLVPRLENWDDLANGQFRDLFGDAARDVEFEFENPTEDEQAEQAERTAAVGNTAVLVQAGFEPAAVLKAMGLPDMPHTGTQASAPATDGGGQGSAGDPGTQPGSGSPSNALQEAMAQALIMQKMYLAVEGNSLITNEEGRDVLRKINMDIPAGPLPVDPNKPSPQVVPAPGGLPGGVPVVDPAGTPPDTATTDGGGG